MITPAAFVRRTGRAWAKRRQGVDQGTVTLGRRRIYILPTAQGGAFGAMVFLMLLGAMNYNNSVGLTITFALTALAAVVMHHCHRTLTGLKITLGHAPPVFAGSQAPFQLTLHNTRRYPRLDIGVFADKRLIEVVSLAPLASHTVTIALPAEQRGYLELKRIAIRSRYPAGLFQTWAWLNTDLRCLVYPKPADDMPPPPATHSAEGGTRDAVSGDSDFAGLRDYRPGDPPRRIAWKSYARSDILSVKTFAGADVAPIFLRLTDAHGEPEERLSILTRWTLDAFETGRRFGLVLGSTTLAPGDSRAHLHRCLRALALHP